MARSKTPGLTQRGGSVWNYDIVVDAVRYQGSTKTTDLKTATLFLSQLRLDIARGKLALKDTRRTLLLEEIHREFLASKTPSASPRYITSATAHWRVWIAPRLGKTPVDRIDAAMVDQLRNDLLVAGRSPVFTNNVLISLRTLLNFAVKRGRLRKALKVELLRVQRKAQTTVEGAGQWVPPGSVSGCGRGGWKRSSCLRCGLFHQPQMESAMEENGRHARPPGFERGRVLPSPPPSTRRREGGRFGYRL